MFDPENIERFSLYKTEHGSNLDYKTVVLSSDYDSLLELYREVLKALEIAASQTDYRSKLQTVRDWLDEAHDMNRPWPEFKKDLQSSNPSFFCSDKAAGVICRCTIQCSSCEYFYCLDKSPKIKS